MPAAKNPQKELSKEQKELCPFGTVKCPICRLSPSQLKDIHHKKNDAGFGIQKILEYIRSTCNISPSYTWISDHFSKHLDIKPQLLEKNTRPEIVKSLQKSLKNTTLRKTSVEMDKAYELIVNMAQEFIVKVDKLAENIPWDDEEVKTKLKDLGPIKSLELIGILHKAGREQLKDIQAIRAPKVMVSHFLDKSIDAIIYETGIIFTDMCSTIQVKVMETIRRGLVVNKDTFADIFKKVALAYVDRMRAMKKEQISLADKALQDLEKLV